MFRARPLPSPSPEAFRIPAKATADAAWSRKYGLLGNSMAPGEWLQRRIKKAPAVGAIAQPPAAFTAATSVVWSLELTAFCTMFFDGYIGAPPTVTVFSFICAEAGTTAALDKRAKVAAAAAIT